MRLEEYYKYIGRSVHVECEDGYRTTGKLFGCEAAYDDDPKDHIHVEPIDFNGIINIPIEEISLFEVLD